LIALAAPEDLRRQALGGEVIEIDTAQVFDASTLEQVSGVRAVRQSAPRHFLVITDDAGAATPRLLQAIQAAGVEVLSSSEYRPSFDEVFSELVVQAEQDNSAEEEDRRVSNSRGTARAA
jgi:hypothetical protein